MASSFARFGLLIVAVAGCGTSPPAFEPGDDDSSSGSDSTSTDSSGEASSESSETASSSETAEASSSDSTGEPPLRCVEGLLDPAEGEGLIEAPTNGAGDDFSGSCGGSGADDVAYEWRPPADDWYVIDTQGADFDTALYVLDGACDGPELACNDNAAGGTYSRVVAEFEADQPVVVVVDGVAGEDGTASLNIARVTCPSADLDGVTLPAEFSNVGGPSTHGGACGGADQPERAFRYTASEAGLYSFSVESDAFGPSLYLEDGPECGSPELGCNAAVNDAAPAEVIRRLDAGQTVTLIVESNGGTGDFTIDAELLDETCPGGVLEAFGEVTGNIENQPHVQTTSCGPATDNLGGSVLPVATYSAALPGQDQGSFGCYVSVIAGFPVAVAVQGGGECGGPELACELGEANDEGRYDAYLALDGTPSTADFTIVVSAVTAGQFWVDGEFVLSTTCAMP